MQRTLNTYSFESSYQTSLTQLHQLIREAHPVVLFVDQPEQANSINQVHQQEENHAILAHLRRSLVLFEATRKPGAVFDDCVHSVVYVRVPSADHPRFLESVLCAFGLPMDMQDPDLLLDSLVECAKNTQISFLFDVQSPATRLHAWTFQMVRQLLERLHHERLQTPWIGSRWVFVGATQCRALQEMSATRFAFSGLPSAEDVALWSQTLAESIQLESKLQRNWTFANLEKQRHAPRDWQCEPSLLPQKDANLWPYALLPQEAIQESSENELCRLFLQSICLAHHEFVRRDVHERWRALLPQVSQSVRQKFALFAAQIARESGDFDAQEEWAMQLFHVNELLATGDSAEAWHLMAQAQTARGQYALAKESLKKAKRFLQERPQASALVEQELTLALAEILFLEGEGASARELAETCLCGQGSASHVLLARNLVGKIALHEGRLGEAEHIFSLLALEAQAVQATQLHLRAKLNLAVTLFAAEKESESVFEQVLSLALLQKEPRAVSLALEHLAMFALGRGEYTLALHRLQQAQEQLSRVGSPSLLAGILHQTAFLYLSIGAFEKAESAALRALRLFSKLSHAPIYAESDEIFARVALSRGRTEEALLRTVRAKEHYVRAGELYRVSDLLRLYARISLLQGNLPQARDALAQSEAGATLPKARAELELLRLQLAVAEKAETETLSTLVASSLELARVCQDKELLLEAQVTAAELAFYLGETSRFAHHRNTAISLYKNWIEQTPEHFRLGFSQKDVSRKLERLHRTESPSPRPFSSSRAAHNALLKEPLAYRPLLGHSEAITTLKDTIARVSRSDSTVLIFGESGTGKERVAEALHYESHRRQGPLVKVCCSAFVESLLLSELFGHEKGAFTGAQSRRIGRFELANKGTIFLDEIGELSLQTQAALLRVLQEKSFERVGSATSIQVDVRVVCATHRDLEDMVAKRLFREDLFYRLCGVRVDVPSLRNRLTDMEELVADLLQKVAEEQSMLSKMLSSDALELFCRHRWPGNIRELENALRTLSLMTEGTLITSQDVALHLDSFRELALEVNTEPMSKAPDSRLPISINLANDDDASLPDVDVPATGLAFEQIRSGQISLSAMKRLMERDCIVRALTETRGNISKAAALLGMKRPRLSQLIKQLGISIGNDHG